MWNSSFSTLYKVSRNASSRREPIEADSLSTSASTSRLASTTASVNNAMNSRALSMLSKVFSISWFMARLLVFPKDNRGQAEEIHGTRSRPCGRLGTGCALGGPSQPIVHALYDL